MNPNVFKILSWFFLLVLAVINFYFYGDFKTIAVFVITLPLAIIWLVIFICSFFIIRKAALRKFSPVSIIFLLLVILSVIVYSNLIDNISSVPEINGLVSSPGKLEILIRMFRFTWPVVFASIFIFSLPVLGKAIVKHNPRPSENSGEIL